MMAASDWTKRPADIAGGELVSGQLVTCNYLSRLQSLAANLELSPDPDGDDRRDLSTIDVSVPWLPAGMPRFSSPSLSGPYTWCRDTQTANSDRRQQGGFPANSTPQDTREDIPMGEWLMTNPMIDTVTIPLGPIMSSSVRRH